MHTRGVPIKDDASSRLAIMRQRHKCGATYCQLSLQRQLERQKAKVPHSFTDGFFPPFFPALVLGIITSAACNLSVRRPTPWFYTRSSGSYGFYKHLTTSTYWGQSKEGIVTYECPSHPSDIRAWPPTRVCVLFHLKLTSTRSIQDLSRCFEPDSGVKSTIRK